MTVSSSLFRDGSEPATPPLQPHHGSRPSASTATCVAGRTLKSAALGVQVLLPLVPPFASICDGGQSRGCFSNDAPEGPRGRARLQLRLHVLVFVALALTSSGGASPPVVMKKAWMVGRRGTWRHHCARDIEPMRAWRWALVLLVQKLHGAQERKKSLQFLPRRQEKSQVTTSF